MDSLRDIKDRVNLFSLAEHLGVEADSRSRRYWCPFGDHGRANLAIRYRGYRCFACGIGGDAFDLVMRVRGCTFPDAVRLVADFAGVPVPPFRSHPRRPTRRPVSQSPPLPVPQAESRTPVSYELRVKLFTALYRALRIPADAPSDHRGLTYLAGRSISRATALATGVCYLPCCDELATQLKNKLPLETLQALGLFNSKGNCILWRHRLLFPFLVGGECVGFQARNTLWKDGEEDGPKELCGGGAPPLPFNVDVLLGDPDEVYLCEGIIDSLSLTEVSLPAIGIPGATRFRAEWAELFIDIPRVIIAFDQDDAGRAGTRRILDHFATAGRTDLRVLELPPGCMDVNEFVKG
jgi:DNA primase